MLPGVQVDAFLSSVRLPTLSPEATEEQPSAPLAADLKLASDEHLLFRLRLGEQEPIAELFKRHARAIHCIGQKMLRDSCEADDLVQEVFLYVYRKAVAFDSSKGSARSWIFQIAYTQAFLRRRKLKSLGFYASGVVDDLRGGEPFIDSFADYDQSVEGLFGRNGWKRIASDLTEDQRETLRLHFFEGYTFAEIAEKLGQSYANVRNHHYRALEKFRKHLVGNAPNTR
jgi:RNA polymerase sigma-70 factor (ECF subfamily)